MRRIVIFAISGLLVLVVIVLFFILNSGYLNEDSSFGQPETLREGKVVIITDMAFVPATVIINKGQKVTWKNDDLTVHNVASDPHPIHTDLPELASGNIQPGQSYSFVFNDTGNFSYHCHLHPEMKGTVVVKD